MSTASRRIGIFGTLVAILAAVACANRLTDENPGAPCTARAAAQTIPTDTTVIEGSPPFFIAASVVDCHGVAVADAYSWSSSDTTILLVTPDGTVTAVGPGTGFAILTGESEGQVGSVRVAVGVAAAALSRRR